MHRLFSVFNQYEFNTSEKCKLFDVLVSSVLNHSSEIWGLNKAKEIEQIHINFLRKLLCVKRSTNLAGLYGELERVPLSEIRKIHIFRYWLKLLKTNDNCPYNNQNWASQIKSMLKNLGLADLWVNQQFYNISLLEIKQRILDQYYQSWYSNISNSQILASYSRSKHSFSLEPYLNNITNRKFKIALSKFRLSSHRLEIERGRYRNTCIPKTDRLCRFCSMNTIENEYHFLLICPLYTDLRRSYLKPYYCHWPTLN